MEILVNVIGQKLKVTTNLKCFISGSQQFVKFIFNMDSEWDNLLTFAQFRQNGVAYNQYLDKDNSVYLPSEIGAGTCTLILYGTYNGVRATTNYLTLTIDESILVTDAQSTEISTSLYEQLVTKVNAITSFNDQSIYEMMETDRNLQSQINTKASQSSLDAEVTRAKRAEQTNANAIELKASQSQVDALELRMTELENDEVLQELVNEAVVNELNEYLQSGVLANMTIADGSITRNKVDSNFEATLTKADTAMQPSMYDPQGLKVDIYWVLDEGVIRPVNERVSV